ncbi:MAG: host-nuclease inhibitor protein Gam [Pseudohongiella sp.]|nr:MAG: host-nuclease inhibitor protein Gam [Pseudohongiella sp.]
MAARSRVKADSMQVPKTQEEAEVILGQIGALQRKLTGEEVTMNNQLAAVKDRYKKKAEQISKDITEAFKRLQSWAEANRDELLPGKRKTANLSTGRLSWRKTPPKVNVKNTDDAIEELRDAGYTWALKTVTVIDKEAILAKPEIAEVLANISISQRTEFVAKPHDTDIEKVAKARD